MTRKIVQIATMPATLDQGFRTGEAAALYALCDDGSVWVRTRAFEKWSCIDAIPQDEAAT